MASNPICHPSPARKMKCSFLDYVHFWWSAGWLMDSNPICHCSPARNMKCSLWDYVQLLMNSQVGQWTRTPSATPLQPKEWNAHFLITFNFWWSAGVVDRLKPHPPPLTSHKNKILAFGLCSTSDDRPGWSMDSNPMQHPSPARKMECSFLDYVHFWWSAGLVDGLEPHPPPLSSQKYEMLIFGLRSTSDVGQAGWWTWTPSTTLLQPKKWKAHLGLCSTSDDCLGWSMDSNAIHHASPTRKIEMLIFGLCSTSDDWLGWLMDSTTSATPLQPEKWNAHFWITFNFWWSAGLVDGLEPHAVPLSSQKNEMLIFGLRSLLLIDQAGQWTQTPSTIPLQPKKWNAHFWITFNFWWLAGLVDGLECHPPPLCSQKNECSSLDYVQLLIISLAGWWTQTPCTTPLQPEIWNACFWIMFNFCWSAGWSMDSNPIHHPSPARKMECSFLDYVHFWWSAGLVDGLETHPPPLSSQKMNCSFLDYIQLVMLARLVYGLEPHLPPLSSQKNEMLIFGLHSTSDDRPGWLMDSNPMQHPSPAKKMKCSFLDYIQLLMISWAGWWSQTPSTTPLQPKKMKCSFLDYIQLLRIGQAGRWNQTPSATPPQPKKWNAHFWITFNFWWSAGLVDGLKPLPPPLSSQKNKILAFGLCSTSDDQPGWWMDSNPICHISPAKKMKCSFLDYVQLLIISLAGWWAHTPSATPLQPGKWNAHLWITFNFWWSAGLVDGLKPHLPPLSSQKNEMLVFGLRSTSDVGRAGWWTWTPSTTLLQPKKWNAHFWIMSTSDN